MVYFKVNRLLYRVMKAAKLWQKSDMGCTRHCDQQLVSLEELEICVEAIQKRIKELESTLKEQAELKEAKETQKTKEKKEAESKASSDTKEKGFKTKEQMEQAMRDMQMKAKLMMATELSAAEIKEAEQELAELKEFEEAEAVALGKQSEMLFTV